MPAKRKPKLEIVPVDELGVLNAIFLHIGQAESALRDRPVSIEQATDALESIRQCTLKLMRAKGG